MISLHIEAADAAELKYQLQGLIAGLAPSRQEIELRTALDEASDIVEYPETLEVPPREEPVAKKTRAKKADKIDASKATPPPPPATGEKGDDLEPPSFLDRRPAEAPKPEVTEPEVSVEAVREIMSKVLGEDATKMKDLTELLAKFKGADGKVCAKASQVQAADRPAVIAGCEAMLK